MLGCRSQFEGLDRGRRFVVEVPGYRVEGFGARRFFSRTQGVKFRRGTPEP